MRYVIKFTKGEEIKFLSHLDLMRTLQRIIKRSKVPVEYSKGFNPHMNMTIAQPLSVGTYSIGEYMDLYLNEDLDEKYIIEKLNESSPRTIKFLNADKVYEYENVKRLKKTMAMIKFAEYDIKIKFNNTLKLNDEFLNFLKSDKIEVLKSGKNEDKIVDIKPLINKINYKIEGNLLIINCILSCGSEENLSVETLLCGIYKYTSNVCEKSFVNVFRKELYTFCEGELMTLDKYYKKFGNVKE